MEMDKKGSEQIYAKLRELRRRRGITVDELAKEVGENAQKVGRIERGKRSLTLDYLMKVSKALSAPIEGLIRQEKPPEERFNSNTLSDVVLLVEEFYSRFSSQKKGKLISKIYEHVLKIPIESQPLFLHALREITKILLENENP
ncbi:MAG: helix-turn-helix transcriptional regulator [Chlamydiae bacterium]|nr:helix-turn-helix transcriptional regulator [Chlamydiota bacterium]